MIRRYFPIFTLLGLFIFTACDKNDSYLKRIEDERDARSKYLSENGITEKNLLDEGIYYQELYTPENAGSDSTRVEEGDEVVLYYTGYFLNGLKFKTNVLSGKFEPLTVRILNKYTGQVIEQGVATRSVISGWAPALLKMSEGTKARIVVPSNRAYRMYGTIDRRETDIPIPGYTTLVYEMEVEEVRKSN